ncbi:MAG: hypothetical protein AABY15_06465 [Nanoarchaeota archaeon]
MGHLKVHSFTGTSDHDFTGLINNYLTKLNSSGTGLTNSMIFDDGIGIGINQPSPAAKLSIKGDRSNASSNSLIVHNSAGTQSFTVRDDAWSQVRKIIVDTTGGYVGGSAQANDNGLIVLSNNQNTINNFSSLPFVVKPINSTNNTFTGIDFRSYNDSVGVIFGVEHTNANNNDFVWWGDSGVPTQRMRLTNSGDLGISSGSPTGRLTVEGNGQGVNEKILNLIDKDAEEVLYVSNAGTISLGKTWFGVAPVRINQGYTSINDFTNNVPSLIGIKSVANSNNLLIRNNAQTQVLFVIKDDGKTGIGIENPVEQLHISGGTIRINTTNATEGLGKIAVSDTGGSISFSSTTDLRISYNSGGTDSTAGVITLIGGTATVTTTKVTASSIIILTVQGGSVANVGGHYISSRIPGTSFVITSTNVLDASDVGWIIIEPSISL